MPPETTIDWTAVRTEMAVRERRLAEVLTPGAERTMQVLAERAARLLRREEAREKEAETELLLVEAGGEKLAIPLTALREVVRVESLTQVPGAVRALCGVINIRGVLHSVMDPLQMAAGVRGELSERPAWAVVLQHKERRLALGVNVLGGIQNVPRKHIETAASAGILQVGGQMFQLLDTAALLSSLEGDDTLLSYPA